jgi:hypothetical protein
MYHRLLANFGGNRMQQFILRLFTGTHSRIVLGLIALMLMTLLIYGSASRNVQAAGTVFT